MDQKTSKDQLRKFGLLIGFLFPIFIGLIIPLLNGHPFMSWTLFVGIPFLILGIIKPNSLSMAYKFWMALGHSLGWVNSRLILGAIFILVVQPISFFMKVFAYDPLRINRRNKKTYKEERENKSIDLERIF